MSKRKKPDDEYREWCNRGSEGIGGKSARRTRKKIALKLSLHDTEKALPDILKTKFPQ